MEEDAQVELTDNAADEEEVQYSDSDMEYILSILDSQDAVEYEDIINTGKARRAQFTLDAMKAADEAIALVGDALEADNAIDKAAFRTAVAIRLGDRDQVKESRRREREAHELASEKHRLATKSAKQAYDAIRFSAPDKMGFMRAVMIFFAGHILFTLFVLLFSSRDKYVYDLPAIATWVKLIMEGMAFWMFVNRYKLAKPFVIAICAISLAVDAIYQISMHQFQLLVFVSDSLFYLFTILYFIFSNRVSYTLVNDLTTYRPSMRDGEVTTFKSGWPFYRNLIMYFIVFSVLGHWMEMAMCQLIIMGLVEGSYDPSNTMLWRDWLFPFPMEGAAVVLIALVLYPLYQNMLKRFSNHWIPLAISFLANALTCSLIEFSMGCIVNADHQYWDYSDHFMNIMGQVCLQNTIAFGVAASVITWFVYPMIERWISKVPYDYMNMAFVAVVVFGAIIWALYLYDPPKDATADDAIAAQSAIEAQQEAQEGETVNVGAVQLML